VLLQPGESKEVNIELDKYAVSYWDDVISKWVAEKGEYAIKIGFTSGAGEDGQRLDGTVTLQQGFEWNGL